MKPFCVATFAEYNFRDLFWFDTELEAEGFESGVMTGADYYSGTCYGSRWPLNADTESQLMDVPERWREDMRDAIRHADKAYEKAKSEDSRAKGESR